MRFSIDDAGRSQSLRPKQKRDCVVRAIALASGMPYDSVYDGLAAMGRKCGRSTSKEIWKAYLDSPAWIKEVFPAIPGQARMHLESFRQGHPLGRFVVQMARHLTAVIDGVIRDDFEPRLEGCVYAVWKFVG